jgi:hypothetical protein
MAQSGVFSPIPKAKITVAGKGSIQKNPYFLAMKKLLSLVLLLLAGGALCAQSLIISVSGGVNDFTSAEKDELIQAYNYSVDDIPTSPTMVGGDVFFRPAPFLTLGAGYRRFLGDGPRNEIVAKFGPTIPAGIFEGSVLLVAGMANGIQDPDFRFAYGTDVELGVRLGNFGIHLRPGVRVFSEELPYEVYDSQNVSQGIQFLQSTVVNLLVEGGVSLRIPMGEAASAE